MTQASKNRKAISETRMPGGLARLFSQEAGLVFSVMRREEKK
ncbi:MULTISPECIES: hypothetical protein [Pantoea]|nr:MULTISPECIES: hypothetical protein [Pantoea]